MAEQKTKAKTTLGRQVAVLPICLDPEGRLRILVLTSRETGRFIVPKGWVKKGKPDCHVAAQEAKQEAGVVGRVMKKPVGRYEYWKRLSDRFERCRVKVFVLRADRQLDAWREKGQRRMAWFLLDDAIDLLDEPGVVAILRRLRKRNVTPQKLRSIWAGEDSSAEKNGRARGAGPLTSAAEFAAKRAPE
jgi:8-oxo-dGTP pyrophosphatase MutT (NUDIX family)